MTIWDIRWLATVAVASERIVEVTAFAAMVVLLTICAAALLLEGLERSAAP